LSPFRFRRFRRALGVVRPFQVGQELPVRGLHRSGCCRDIRISRHGKSSRKRESTDKRTREDCVFHGRREFGQATIGLPTLNRRAPSHWPHESAPQEPDSSPRIFEQKAAEARKSGRLPKRVGEIDCFDPPLRDLRFLLFKKTFLAQRLRRRCQFSLRKIPEPLQIRFQFTLRVRAEKPGQREHRRPSDG